MSSNRDAWLAFLNPDVVKGKLVEAGLFVVAHEILLDSITRHPLEFFAKRWTAKGPEQSQRYQDEVLALDPKGKNDTVRGSIAWLKKVKAIGADDEDAYLSVTKHRNVLAHELSAFVTGGASPDIVRYLPRLVELVSKIEKWWIVNVELASDPDFDHKDAEVEKIVPGVIVTLQVLAEVALTEGDAAWELHRWFEKEWPRPH